MDVNGEYNIREKIKPDKRKGGGGGGALTEYPKI